MASEPYLFKMMGDGEDMLRASIPISQGQLFIRTSKNLFCVGKK